MGGAGVRLQDVPPEALEVSAKLRKTFRLRAINPPGPHCSFGHQTRVLEDLQMLGDSRSADGKLLGDLTHGCRVITQHLEDRAPGGIGEGSEDIRVSHSLR